MKLYGQEDTVDMVIDLKNILEDIERAEENGCSLVELQYIHTPNFKVQHSRQYRALKTAINLLAMVHENNLDLTLRDILYKMVNSEHRAQFYGMKVKDYTQTVDKEMIKTAFKDLKNKTNMILNAIEGMEQNLK